MSINKQLPEINGTLSSLKKEKLRNDEEFLSHNPNELHESDESHESNESQDSDESDKIKSVFEKRIDPNASFFATFIDGSSLRYLIDYLRVTSLDGTFVFSKNYITYQKGNNDGTILNDVKIKTYELTEYEFSSSNTEIITTLNLSELRNKTRTVGKKEQLDIYRRAEEPSNFYIQVRSQEKSSDNPVFYCMHMTSEDVTIFELPIYKNGKRNPNCTVYQSDFSKVCKSLVANKCSYTEFIGFEKGIIIKGYSTDGKIAMVKEYGKCRNTHSKSANTKSIINLVDKNVKPQIITPKISIRDINEIERFKVHISDIKGLAKINGFSPTGTLKFYIEKGLPMKISTSIGTFGKLNILVRSC